MINTIRDPTEAESRLSHACGKWRYRLLVKHSLTWRSGSEGGGAANTGGSEWGLLLLCDTTHTSLTPSSSLHGEHFSKKDSQITICTEGVEAKGATCDKETAKHNVKSPPGFWAQSRSPWRWWEVMELLELVFVCWVWRAWVKKHIINHEQCKRKCRAD